MKKIVIAGSAKLQKEVNKWLDFFASKDYEILDYPRPIDVGQRLGKILFWLHFVPVILL